MPARRCAWTRSNCCSPRASSGCCWRATWTARAAPTRWRRNCWTASPTMPGSTFARRWRRSAPRSTRWERTPVPSPPAASRRSPPPSRRCPGRPRRPAHRRGGTGPCRGWWTCARPPRRWRAIRPTAPPGWPRCSSNSGWRAPPSSAATRTPTAPRWPAPTAGSCDYGPDRPDASASAPRCRPCRRSRCRCSCPPWAARWSSCAGSATAERAFSASTPPQHAARESGRCPERLDDEDAAMNLFRTLLLWLVLALAGALAAQLLLSQDPGTVLVRWRGYDYTTTVLVAVALLFVAAFARGLVWPRRALPSLAWGRQRDTRARARIGDGLDALRQGHWSRAEKLLAQAAEDERVESAARLGAAEAAVARGDHAAARTHLAGFGERHPALRAI